MFETILELQNPHWRGEKYAGLFNRLKLDALLKKLILKEIQVLLGVRRSGKSTLFKLIINHLLLQKVQPTAILYINLDDPFYSEVSNAPTLLHKIVETSQKLTGVRPIYLFLDEIQTVIGWEKYVKSVYDSECFKKIFITGSNSSLLKQDYAILLSGRYLVDAVMPLSFQEILHNEGIETPLQQVREKSHLLHLAERLLKSGGFPEIWKTADPALQREQLIAYYETILLKDCVGNHKIRDIKKFKALALYLLTNNSALYSYNSLAKAIDSNENTVKEFITILEDSFLVQEVKHFSYFLKEQTKLPKKSYCTDNGFIHAVSFRFSENRGKLFENLVYTELSKYGVKDIYYFTQEKECDFVIQVGKAFIALQITFELKHHNRNREINGLRLAMNKLAAFKGYIVTFDDEEETVGDNMFIIPFWKLTPVLNDLKSI